MSFESTDTLSRIAAPLNGLRRGVDSWGAERREAQAFRRAGQEIANSRSVADDDRFDPFFAALSRHQARQEIVAAALENSLKRERADCAEVVLWVRPLVMLRGLCDRALLHYQLQRYRREMGLCHEARGRAARRYSVEGMTLEQRHVLRFRRTRLARVAGQRVARSAARTAAAAGQADAEGIGAGGLSRRDGGSRRPTDSHLRSVMNTVGLGRGGTHGERRHVQGDELWLPLAAAICAYLGDRLARMSGTGRKTAGDTV
jgi:hypothetical protein